MIAFACFIVISEYTKAIDNQSKSVLETVDAPGKRRRQAPDYHFHERILGKNVSLVE